MIQKKHWQSPQVVEYDTIVALTMGDDKCGTAIDAVTETLGLDGNIMPEEDCIENF